MTADVAGRAGRLGRAISRTARVGAVVALAAAMVVIPGARRSRAADKPPSVFDITATASPVLDELAAVTVVPLPLDHGVAKSSVSMNSQPFVISQAAIVSVPLGETVLATQPDAARLLWCYSYFPTAPGSPGESECGGGGALGDGFPVEAGSGHTVTTGDDQDPTTLSSQSSARAVGVGNGALPLSIGTVASSAASKGVDDRMTAAASTAVDDIDIAGVLQIRSVRSSVTGALSGDHDGAAADRQLTIEGATVAGQPVVIDQAGVHAAGQSPLPPVGLDPQEQVNQVLRAAGIKVSLLPAPAPQVSEDGTDLSVSSGYLHLELTSVQTGILAVADIGTAQLTMQASRVDDVDFDSEGSSIDATTSGTASAPPVADVTDGTGSSELGTVSGTTSSASGAPKPPAAPKAGANAGTPRKKVSQVAIQPVAVERWKVPYAPYALLVLAIPLALSIRRLTLVRRYDP